MTAAFAVSMLLAAGTAFAQSGSVFTVEDIAVDRTAETEVLAKQAAIAAGSQEALQTLLRRLTLPGDWPLLPGPSAEEVERLLRNTSVSDERIGGGRYLANVTYRFRASSIRRLLRQNAIAYAETASRPVVVLPILDTPAGAVLWDEGNQWLQAWNGIDAKDGLVPLLVPLGDLTDVSAIGVQQALAGEPVSVGRFASKYRAAGVLTVVARANSVPGGGTGVSVSVTGFGRGWDGVAFVETVPPLTAETSDALFQRSATQLAGAIEGYWKQANLISGSQAEQRLSVQVPLADLRGWLSVQDKLRKLAFVRQTVVRELTIRSAELDILYTGDLAQLRRGLSQQNLNLSQDPVGGQWRLDPVR